MNSAILIGRLVRDPDLRYIQNSGQAVSTFTLAVDKNLSKDKKQEMESRNQPTADFINIKAWGKVAENCATYLAKGRLVAVQGRIQTGSYDDKDGKKVYTTEINANQVKFLEWGDRQGNQSKEFEGFHPVSSDDIPF